MTSTAAEDLVVRDNTAGPSEGSKPKAFKKPKRIKKGVGPPKEPIFADCSKCRLKCPDKFGEEERREICATYYGLSSREAQWDFLLHRMTCESVKTRTTQVEVRKRNCSCRYSFINSRGAVVNVCQRFFLATLGMKTDTVVQTARRKRGTQGQLAGRDERGRRTTGNKFKPEVLAKVRQHIESFPTVASKTAKRNSTRRYLDSSLNIQKMYRLYREWASQPENEVTKTVSSGIYRKIFKTSYNLAFAPLPQKRLEKVKVKKSSPVLPLKTEKIGPTTSMQVVGVPEAGFPIDSYVPENTKSEGNLAFDPTSYTCPAIGNGSFSYVVHY